MPRQVFWGFEQLSITIEWWIMEFQSGVKIAAQCMISKYSETLFVSILINRNPCYPTQNCQEWISLNAFHPFNSET